MLEPLGLEVLMEPGRGLGGFGLTSDRKPFFWIYHPRYYGAFVLDPDGNNVEAVCHDAL